MNQHDLGRRDFHRLTLAALGGLAAGAMSGCGSQQGGSQQDGADRPATSGTGPDSAGELTEAEQILVSGPHVCRGLNSCKGQGKGGDNACAGMGACASLEHACAGQNECKGQGGCGADPGMNACKGQGGCHIPLMDDAWTKARATFESALKKQGKEFGASPAKT